MANHASAEKRIRANDVKRIRNRYYSKTTRNAIRRLRASTTKKEAEGIINTVFSMIDKLAKRNVIHKNKAGNLKSKLAHTVQKLS